MAKVSRPILYLVVMGAVAYAAVLLTEPEQTAKKVAPRASQSASKAPAGFTEADMNASFPRYNGKYQDAFKPKIIVKKEVPAPAPTQPMFGAKGVGVWSLTGINSINGVRSALVENNTTQETIFLEVGETWNGFTVQAIEPSAVVLVSVEGKQTRLIFNEFAEEPTPAASPGVGVVTATPSPQPGNPATPGGARP